MAPFSHLDSLMFGCLDRGHVLLYLPDLSNQSFLECSSPLTFPLQLVYLAIFNFLRKTIKFSRCGGVLCCFSDYSGFMALLKLLKVLLVIKAQQERNMLPPYAESSQFELELLLAYLLTIPKQEAMWRQDASQG